MSKIDLILKAVEFFGATINCNWDKGEVELVQRNGEVSKLNFTDEEIWQLTNVNNKLINKIPF